MDKKTSFAKIDQKKIILAVFVIIIILSITVFRNTIQNTITLYKANRELRLKLSGLIDKKAYLENLDDGQLAEQVRQTEQVFPSKKPVMEFLNSMKYLAFEDKVLLGGFSLKPGQFELDRQKKVKALGDFKKTKLENFEINLSVNGTFDDIVKFIKDLEKTAPLLSIDKIGLAIKNKEVDPMIVSASLAVTVYYQKAPDTIPAVDAKVIKLSEAENKILDQLSIFKFRPLIPSENIYQGRTDPFKKSE